MLFCTSVSIYTVVIVLVTGVFFQRICARDDERVFVCGGFLSLFVFVRSCGCGVCLYGKKIGFRTD